MEFTIFIRKQATIEIKEYLDKPPIIIGKLEKPQLLIDSQRATITIIETK